MSAFSELLTRLIDSKFESRRAFVRSVNPAINNDIALENAAQGYLSKVANDHLPPLMDRVSLWADALELTGLERQKFMDLAAIAHIPEAFQPRFTTLLAQFEAAQSQIGLINSRLDALESQRERPKQ